MPIRSSARPHRLSSRLRRRDRGYSIVTVEIKGLRKSYGNNQVLHNLTIQVGEGEFLTLLGPSGCGKTTTLRCVAGLESADGGTITIDGRWSPRRPAACTCPPTARHRHGLPELCPLAAMTVFGNVAYPLRMRRTGSAIARQRVTEDPQDGRDDRFANARSASCPAASSSAWRWRARWFPAEACCSSTSHCPTWTRSCGARCVGKSGRLTTCRAAPRSTSPMTRKKRSRCLTGSSWSATVRSSSRVAPGDLPRAGQRASSRIRRIRQPAGRDRHATRGHTMRGLARRGLRADLGGQRRGRPGRHERTARRPVRAPQRRATGGNGRPPAGSVTGVVRTCTYTGQHVEYVVDVGPHNLLFGWTSKRKRPSRWANPLPSGSSPPRPSWFPILPGTFRRGRNRCRPRRRRWKK